MSTTVFVTLTPLTCHKCSAVFGLNQEFVERARNEGQIWHCPHCRVASIFSELENTRLKRELAQAQTNIEHKEARISSLREEKAQLERSRAALRGVHTRTCNRVKHGVCPCCNRTFGDLARHMGTKHPGFRAQVA